MAGGQDERFYCTNDTAAILWLLLLVATILSYVCTLGVWATVNNLDRYALILRQIDAEANGKLMVELMVHGRAVTAALHTCACARSPSPEYTHCIGSVVLAQLDMTSAMHVPPWVQGQC